MEWNQKVSLSQGPSEATLEEFFSSIQLKMKASDNELDLDMLRKLRDLNKVCTLRLS